MIIEKFVNQILTSNCYLIVQENCKNVIVVDPGDSNLTALINYLSVHNLIVEYVIFTHEHYDHIAGGNLLKQIFNCKFIGSEECAEAIINPKKNLSIFYDSKYYISQNIDLTTEQLNYLLIWNSTEIKFMKTPGHSKGSICLYLENNIFTGDTLIKDEKTLTNLPGGNKHLLAKSLEMINNICNQNTTFYPGHNEVFGYDRIIFSEIKQ